MAEGVGGDRSAAAGTSGGASSPAASGTPGQAAAASATAGLAGGAAGTSPASATATAPASGTGTSPVSGTGQAVLRVVGGQGRQRSDIAIMLPVPPHLRPPVRRPRPAVVTPASRAAVASRAAAVRAAAALAADERAMRLWREESDRATEGLAARWPGAPADPAYACPPDLGSHLELGRLRPCGEWGCLLEEGRAQPQGTPGTGPCELCDSAVAERALLKCWQCVYKACVLCWLRIAAAKTFTGNVYRGVARWPACAFCRSLMPETRLVQLSLIHRRHKEQLPLALPMVRTELRVGGAWEAAGEEAQPRYAPSDLLLTAGERAGLGGAAPTFSPSHRALTDGERLGLAGSAAYQTPGQPSTAHTHPDGPNSPLSQPSHQNHP